MAFATTFVSPKYSCSKRLLAAVWKTKIARFAVERGKKAQKWPTLSRI
jgi:hypothetical protein